MRDAIGAGGESTTTSPVESPASIRSHAFARMILLISEGPIEGFSDPVHPWRCVTLDGTPVESNSPGVWNFSKVAAGGSWCRGTQDQGVLTGFSDVEVEQSVNVEIKDKLLPGDASGTGAVIRTVSDATVDSVRLRFAVGPFYRQDTTNNQVNPTIVTLQVWIQPNGGSYSQVSEFSISGQTEGKYEVSRMVRMVGTGPWNIKIVRTDPDSASPSLQNKTYWESMVLIHESKLSYPNRSIFALQVDSSQFQRIPTVGLKMRLLKVKVPSNYDPLTRVYTGVWDGTFKLAWTNNPAWCWYDLITEQRYGCGRWISAAQVDKWGLYTIAQYCDAMVPSGKALRAACDTGSTSLSTFNMTPTSTSVGVDVTATKYTRSSGSWITDGHRVDGLVSVSGATKDGNNGVKLITAVTATELTVSGTLTAETGATVTVIGEKRQGYARAAGSFLTDGFMVGDEINPTGYTNAGNNGRGRITSVTDTEIQVGDEKTIVVEGASAGRRIVTQTPTEPRFTCNLYLQEKQEAWRVIVDMAAIFRAMAFWAGGSIYASQDAPQDPAALFTPANVIDGRFTYQGTSRKTRINRAIVWWNDPEQNYRRVPEVVQDMADIRANGLREKEVTAIGTTSQGQAHRYGQWLIYSTNSETETCSWQTGIDVSLLTPGQIVQTQDPSRTGKRAGGRLSKGSTVSSLILDSAVTLDAGKSYVVAVMMPDGTMVERSISNGAGSTLVLSLGSALPSIPVDQAIWIVRATDEDPELWRVMGIKEIEPHTFEITGIAHNPAKFALIENITVQPPQVITPFSPPAPTGVTLTEGYYVTGADFASILYASWQPSPGAIKYRVNYRKANGDWTELPGVNGTSAEVRPVPVGAFEVGVIAISSQGAESAATIQAITITGKAIPPSNVSGLTATQKDATLDIRWTDISDPDRDLYELRYGASWATGTLITRLRGTSYQWPLPVPGAYTIRIKAIDTSGNYSVTDTSVVATVSPSAATGLASQIYAIGDDSTLDKGEKARIITEYNAALADYVLLLAKAQATATPYSSFASAFVGLQSYLLALSPAYNDTTQDTAIVAANWQTFWGDFYREKTALVIKLSGAPPSAVDLVSTSNLNLTTNAAAPTIDSATSAAGNVVLVAGQTNKAENGIYNVSYTPPAGSPAYYYPTTGTASYTGAAGSYTNGANAFDASGTPTDGTYATLSANASASSTETVIFSGWSGSNLTGTLHAKITPMLVTSADGANGTVTVSHSTDGGATYSTPTVYHVSDYNTLIDYTASLSSVTGSQIRVKVTATTIVPRIENPGTPPPFYIDGDPGVGITRVNSVYLYVPASGSANYSFTKTADILDGTLWRPKAGSVYGGKIYSAAVASDNTVTLTQQAYDAGSYDINCSVSGKPGASAKVLTYPAPRPFTIQAQGHTGVCGTNNTTNPKDFTVAKNGTTFGTLRFGAAGAFSLVGFASASFATNDVLTITAPASQDATLADIGFTLRGNI